MKNTNIWLIGAVVLTVAIVVGGWFVGVQPQLGATASAELQRAQVLVENARHQAELDKLKADYGQLSALKADLAELRESVPAGADLPAFVDQLNALYDSSGVSFVGYTTAAALPYAPQQGSGQQPAAGSSSGSSPAPSSTPTPSAGATPSGAGAAPATAASGAPAPGAPPVVNALVTGKNFVATPLTVNVQGPYANILTFVKGVQTGKRLFLVTNLQITKSTDTATPGSFDATVTGLIYSMVADPSGPSDPAAPADGDSVTASK